MASGTATAPVNTTNTALARGTDVSPGTIPIDQGMDVVVVTVTFAPGGSTGWHLHPGGAIVIVKAGDITLYRSVGNHCDLTTFTAGQAFIERPGDVHDAVNTGTTQAIVYVTFPSVPVGKAARIDAPDPGTCPGI
jgi:quercetin dioxygenase-like cupin family protein